MKYDTGVIQGGFTHHPRSWESARMDLIKDPREKKISFPTMENTT
jgi:hypothetical protein